MSSPYTHDSRSAVDKAIALLTAFRTVPAEGAGVSELARRTGMSKSTAFRLLGILERNALLYRCGSNYRLGQAIHDLGETTQPRGLDSLREMLTPCLIDLYEHTHETVHLAALHGTEVIYLNKLYGYRAVPAPSRIGGRAPAYCTGVGKALLAYDHEALVEVIASGLRPFTPKTIVDAGILQLEMAGVRKGGVAYDNEEVRAGLTCIAAPILAASGQPVAALSVSGRTGQISTERLVPILRRVAYTASQVVARHHRHAALRLVAGE